MRLQQLQLRLCVLQLREHGGFVKNMVYSHMEPTQTPALVNSINDDKLAE